MANELSKIAESQREYLIPFNLYNNVKENDGYSAQHPNSMSDGDEKGRGTSNFLGVNNYKTGTLTDVLTRKSNLVPNEYSRDNQYYIVTDNDAVNLSDFSVR